MINIGFLNVLVVVVVDDDFKFVSREIRKNKHGERFGFLNALLNHALALDVSDLVERASKRRLYATWPRPRLSCWRILSLCVREGVKRRPDERTSTNSERFISAMMCLVQPKHVK